LPPLTDISAVLVTRGNVDLQPILDSLIFDDVVIWDNSTKHRDEMTFGRVLGAMLAKNCVIYSQDDDIIHSAENQQAIVDAYQPGVLVGCMWDEWSDGARRQGIENGYDDLVFPGSGSICDLDVWKRSIVAYLTHWPHDDFFRLWSDTIIGVISPTIQLDIRFEERECSNDDYRMAHLSDAVALKTEAIRRGRSVRARQRDAALT